MESIIGLFNQKREANIMSRESILLALIFISFSMPIGAGTVDYNDDTELSFIWEAASGDVDHYKVYLSTDWGKYVL